MMSCVAAVLTLILASPSSMAGEPHDTPDVVHSRPAAGRILRGFEPPAGYGRSGHRGVDFAARVGDIVRASADGVVSFSGAVAGVRWLSLRHADGVVTSHGPLTMVTLRKGDLVGGGDAIGRIAAGGHGADGANGSLHWSARHGGRYIDPLSLLAPVPRPSLIAAGDWAGTHHMTVAYDAWGGGSFGGLLTASSPVATRPGYAIPPNANHLVIIGGLASSSSSDVIDPSHLGYVPESVSEFSYAGLDDSDPPLPRAYGPRDTWAGPGPAAKALADHLAAIKAAQPGRAVDIVAHSMGGLVALRYLLEHHDAYDLELPPIGNVVAFDSPFRGSDVASIGGLVMQDPAVGPVVAELQSRTRIGVDDLALDAPAIRELAVGSPELNDLAERWGDAWDRATDELPTGPLAMKPRLLTIGGSKDLVVLADRAAQPSAPWYGPVGDRERVVDGEVVVAHRVLPGGHSGVLDTEAAREVVHDFLAGGQPTSSPGRLSSVLGRGAGTLTRMAVAVVEWVRQDRGLW